MLTVCTKLSSHRKHLATPHASAVRHNKRLLVQNQKPRRQQLSRLLQPPRPVEPHARCQICQQARQSLQQQSLPHQRRCSGACNDDSLPAVVTVNDMCCALSRMLAQQHILQPAAQDKAPPALCLLAGNSHTKAHKHPAPRVCTQWFLVCCT